MILLRLKGDPFATIAALVDLVGGDTALGQKAGKASIIRELMSIVLIHRENLHDDIKLLISKMTRVNNFLDKGLIEGDIFK